MKKTFIFCLITLFTVSAIGIQGRKKKDITESNTPSTKFHINYRYWDKQVINNCGFKGFPENSFIGLEEAVMQGFQTVKCDVAFSKDDVPILSHSPRLERSTYKTGLTTDYTIRELIDFDFGIKTHEKFRGTHVTTLNQILLLCRRNNVMLEIDCSDKERFPNSRYQCLYNYVKKNGMLESTIFCDNAENLETLLDIDPNVIISIHKCINKKDIDKALEVAKRAQAADFSIRKSLVSQTLIDYIHEKGFPIKVWNVDDLNDLKNFVKMGADRIVSKEYGPKFNYRIVEMELED